MGVAPLPPQLDTQQLFIIESYYSIGHRDKKRKDTKWHI
jgi:hypothetical protein